MTMNHMLSLLLLSLLSIATSAEKDLKRINFHNGLIRVPVKEKLSDNPFASDHLPSHYDPVHDTIFLNQRGLETLANSLPNATNLYNDSFGVAITLDSDSMQTLNISADTEITMQLVISAQYTYLSAGCDAFINVNLTEANCDSSDVDDDVLNVNYTAIKQYRADVQSYFFNSTNPKYCLTGIWPGITLAGSPWDTQAVLFLENCQYAPGYFGNSQSYGFIGLDPFPFGTETDSSDDAQPILFSFLINSTSGEGQLIFGIDSTYTANSHLALSLSVDEGHWQTTYNSYTFGAVFEYTNLQPLLTFDVIYQRIAFDSAQYKNIMLYLLEFEDQGMQCSYNKTATEFSDCYFAGDIWALPNLSYDVEDASDNSFTLPPTVYMEDLGNCTYKTMFDAFNSDFFNVTDSNMEGTVLGAKVMSKFYSVFNKTDPCNEAGYYCPNITLYPLDPNLFTNTSNISNTSTCSIPNNLPNNNNGNTNTGNNNSSNTTTGNNTSTGSTNPPDTNGTDPAGKGGMNSTLIIIIAVLGVCVLLGGGFLLYRHISLRSKRNRSGTGDVDLSSKLGDKSEEEIRPYSG